MIFNRGSLQVRGLPAPKPSTDDPIKQVVTSNPDPFLAITQQYLACHILDPHVAELNAIKARILNFKAAYESVAMSTCMPWYLIAAIHSLEASLNFRTYLHNGDPLFNSDGNPVKTVHVPAGVGPFDTWMEAAVDALGGQRIGIGVSWSLGFCLHWAELYNGRGYLNRGIPSPYVWSFTDQYSHGKFIADGVFSPTAVSDQAGVAAIFKVLGL